jgi:competence protein ComEC
MSPAALLPFAAVTGLAAGILLSELGGPEVGRPLAAGTAVAAASGALLAAAGGRVAMLAVLAAACIGGAAVGVVRGGTVALATGPGSIVSLIGAGEVELSGVAVDDARPREDRQQIVLGELSTDADAPVDGRLLLWLPRGIALGAGDRVDVHVTPEEPRDFDGFAYRAYLARQGIGAIGRATDAMVTPGSGPVAILAGLRTVLRDGLNAIVPEPEAALGAGILLGIRSGIAPEIDGAFADAGLTHVVAISGWNIAIVAAVVAAIVAPLGRHGAGRWASAGIGVGAVAGYVVLSGAGPSVVRAALLAAAMLLVRLGGSRAHAASALCAAAGIMLVAAPAVLWDVGFQLSLLATGGLIWFGGGIEGRLRWLPPLLREPIALTLAAQLTTLPVLLVNFERLSLVAPIANVAVVPIVPFAMLACSLAAVAGAIAAALPVPLVTDVLTWGIGGAAWLGLHLMIAAGLAFAAVPAAAIDVTVPAPLAVAWYPCLGLAWWSMRSPPAGDTREVRLVPGAAAERRPARLTRALREALRPRWLVAALLVVLSLTSLGGRPDGRLHLFALDIGQGDALLARTPDGVTMLIDGGPDPELSLREIGASLPWNVRRIDVVLLSHPHQDHVAGLVDVLRRYRVGLVLHAGIAFENVAYDQFLADAESRQIKVRLARAGDQLALGAATSLEVVYPTEADASAPLPEGDINNGSVVAILRYGGFSVLLTGDAEAPIEGALMERGLVPDVDVLKVGHHGSASSTTPTFLAAAAPEVAIISSGVDNEYGHPAPETLATLASVPGLAVFRTDTDGRIEITSDGQTYTARSESGALVAQTDDGATAAPSDAATIGTWPFPISPPPVACSARRGCLTGSWSTPRVSVAWRWPRPAWSSRPGSRSTVASLRRRGCSTTSTRHESAAMAASTASSRRGCSPIWATASSRSRSPPTRSAASSTTSASRSAGRRCCSPSPTATSPKSSSPSTSVSTT